MERIVIAVVVFPKKHMGDIRFSRAINVIKTARTQWAPEVVGYRTGRHWNIAAYDYKSEAAKLVVSYLREKLSQFPEVRLRAATKGTDWFGLGTD